jgi:hypothetical protein
MPRKSDEEKIASGLFGLARRHPVGCGCLAGLALLVALVFGAIYLVRMLRQPSKDAPPATTTTTTAGAGLPDMPAKPRPRNESFRGCPPEGDGGDPELNRLKNRVDEGNYAPVAFDAILNLPWPRAVEGRNRARWRREDAEQVARWEGLPVAVEGYIAKARLQGPETPNCHGADQEFKDYHVWLTKTAGEERERSIVVEPTPPVRAKHPAWTLDNLNRARQQNARVRISGWLLLDPEHPDQIGKTRGTIWEIHPVMKIEVQQGGRWVNLDDWR